MLNLTLIKNVLVVAIGSSIITTSIIQKIKERLKTKKSLWFVSLGVSILFGTLFAYCFSDLSLVNCLWVGLVSWVGASAIYSAFEDKIFKPFSEMNKTIEAPAENVITLDELIESGKNE